jgi:molybdenum cofactor cytidylyltransferase
MIAGLVLAAGAGERFGGGKQLAELDGRPLLEHVLLALAAAPLDRVAVVLGSRAGEVRELVPLHGAEPVVCKGWQEGMAASLRAGVAALDGAEAVVIALGDQPRIASEAVARLIASRGDDALAVRASYHGTPGHPVLLERALLERVPELRGDAGARELLSEARVVEVACDGWGSPDDVDTPAVLAALQGLGAGSRP